MRLALALCAMGALLAGCSAMPSHGPATFREASDAKATVTSDTHKGPGYVFIKINELVLGHLRTTASAENLGSFKDRGPSGDVLIGPGDQVVVTVFESEGGGLFIPREAGSRPGNFIEMPSQTVDRQGMISVPFAGRIKAGGRTALAVAEDIEQHLANRAIEPQVVVTVSEQRSTQVSVLGDVNQPGRFPILQSGERILDAIARAGGPRSPSYETFVTLQRGGRDVTVAFDVLVRDPKNNIYVRPSDVIYVARDPRSYIVLGAAGENGLYNFDAENMSLADAVAKAGGLLDARANPAGVYLYRREPVAQLAAMGVDVAGLPLDATLPTIYHLNMKKPGGLFLAKDFPLLDGDSIFISNSDSVQLTKVLTIFRLVTGSARDIAAVKSDVENGSNDDDDDDDDNNNGTP